VKIRSAFIVTAALVGAATFASSRTGVTPKAAAVAAGYSWGPARVDGGGFLTVLAPSRVTKNLWLAGSDVAGIFRSVDGGKTWLGATRGFEGTNERKVGAIEWDPFNAKRAWACVGSFRKGLPVGGGVVRTTDAGLTWATISHDVMCSGGVFPDSGITGNHPRSTGRLLIADRSHRDFLWIGTLTNGVARSTDGGLSWSPRGLTGLPIRGLALDPQNPDIIYAAVRSASLPSGVYRTTNANAASPTWKLLTGPTVAEELVISGRRLYVAAGPQGVWTADLSAANPQLVRTSSQGLVLDPPPHDTDVMTINAFTINQVENVFIGLDMDAHCLDPGLTFCPTLYRSTDRGTSWSPVPGDPAGIHTTIGGPTGRVWRQAVHPESLLAGDHFITSDLQLDPFAANQFLMAGRTGIWRSTDSGSNWYPVPKGLTLTFHGRPEIDSTQTGDVLMPTSDWNLLTTTDNGTTVTDIHIRADTNAAARLSGWTGPGPAPIYVAAGPLLDVPEPGEPTKPDVYVSEPAGSPFGRLGLSRVDDAVGTMVMAVAVRDVEGQRVVVAIDRLDGVWRMAGSEPWTKVASTPGGPDGTIIARTATLVWAPDGTLYAADRGNPDSTGVWRSVDTGLTWERITPDLMDIAIDPTSPHRLWLAGNDQIWRIDDARTGTTEAGTLVISRRTSLPAARMVAVDPTGGVVAVTAQVPAAQLGQRGVHGKVFTSIDSGQTFAQRSTDAVSRGLVEPVGLVVDTSGAIHIGTFGFGWWVGRPG
jgi:hypothetical protein